MTRVGSGVRRRLAGRCAYKYLSFAAQSSVIIAALFNSPAAAQGSHAAAVGNAGTKNEVKFEVISIRNPAPNSPIATTDQITPDGYTAQLSLLQLITLAYASEQSPAENSNKGLTQVSNGPTWIWNWYVINARVSDDDREAWSKQSNQHELLRSALRDMLKERFKLVIREVPAQLDGLQLVVERKNGPTFAPSNPGSPLPVVGKRERSGGISVGGLEGGHMVWRYYASTMEDLARFLTSSTHQPLRDMTGLTGHYDFTLKSIDMSSLAHDPDEEMYNWPLDPLGLALKRGKVPGVLLVIDHIEQRTPN